VGTISHLANAESRRAERGFALAEEEAARQTEPSAIAAALEVRTSNTGEEIAALLPEESTFLRALLSDQCVFYSNPCQYPARVFIECL
jgi:hypothetical protein